MLYKIIQILNVFCLEECCNDEIFIVKCYDFFFKTLYILCLIVNFIRILMQTKSKRKYNYCKDHDFHLHPLSNDLYIKESIKVSFCKGKYEQSKNSSNKNACKCLPIVNLNENPFSRLFISLESARQKKYFQRKSYYDQYTSRQSIEQKSEIPLPIPNSRNKFCAVCDLSYFDYSLHIRSKSHKQSIKECLANSFILDLQKLYRLRLNEKGRIFRRQKSKSSGSTMPIWLQQIDPLGKPQKKVKKEIIQIKESQQIHFSSQLPRGKQTCKNIFVPKYLQNLPNINLNSWKQHLKYFGRNSLLPYENFNLLGNLLLYENILYKYLAIYQILIEIQVKKLILSQQIRPEYILRNIALCLVIKLATFRPSYCE